MCFLPLSDISVQSSFDHDDRSWAEHFSKYEIIILGEGKKESEANLCQLLYQVLFLSRLIFTALWSINYLYFTDVKTEAQRNFTILRLSILNPKNMLFVLYYITWKVMMWNTEYHSIISSMELLIFFSHLNLRHLQCPS